MPLGRINDRFDLKEHIPVSQHALLDAIRAGAPPPDPTPMTATENLSDLSTLNLASLSTIGEFLFVTRMGSVEPITLGSHAETTYFLQPAVETVPQLSNYTPTPVEVARSLSDDLCVYESVPIQSSAMTAGIHWKYGFGLGTLAHCSTSDLPPNGGGANPFQLTDTGFFVLLSAIDRSVWIAIDWYPPDELGSRPGLDGQDWGRLPNDPRLQIGVMQISRPQWARPSSDGIVSITASDPFVTFPAIPCRLIFKPATEKDYLAAVSPPATTKV